MVVFLFISVADSRFNLGTSRAEKIELIQLGWDKEILIQG
jgi:hypothetical protein